MTMDAAGGGGFGNPLKRDAKEVLRDVREGYVSLDRAREAYGVIIDADAMQLDLDRTAALRSSRLGPGE